MFDFVAEQGAENDAWAMTAPDGSQYVIGYGGELRIPTLDFVAGEKNIIGNIVGTYNDLAELMVLAQAGKVTLHTKQYPLDAGRSTPCTTSTPAACAAARSSSPDRGLSRPDPRAPDRAAHIETTHRVKTKAYHMYEKDGEKYFIVDSHCHFWDASRENWKPGQRGVREGLDRLLLRLPPARPAGDPLGLREVPEGHARGDFERDMFERGPRRPTRSSSPPTSRSGTPTGFNTLDQNGSLPEKCGGRLIVNGRWDPREGDAGLKQLEADAERWNLKGVKLYTAEWHDGSRGWKLTDPEAYRFLEKCQELGIKNIHAHKGPTIWPLNKDAFDMTDVDHAATDFTGPELHRRARGHPAHRGLLLHGGAGAQRLRRPVRGHRRAHARPARSSSPR